MTIIEERVAQMDRLILSGGAHPAPLSEDAPSACVMEAVAWVAGEKWSDRPKCVSPVIGAFLRRWNDDLDDACRQRLKPYILRVVGTNTGKADDNRRAWLATDWLVRMHTPAWLELGGMKEQAEALRALPELTSSALAVKAQPKIDEARSKAAAAGAAARDAAWDAAGAAARDAAWDAAGAAARAAAWDAACKKLEPTKLSLQESAFVLLDRMISVGAAP